MFYKLRKVVLTAKIKFYEMLNRYYISKAYKCIADGREDDRRRWIKKALRCTSKCVNMRTDLSK